MRHPIVRYGVALAVTAAAGALRGALGWWFPGLVPFATFFPAVLVATLVGGLGPGLLATLLGVLWAWFFWLQPAADLAPPATAAAVNLALFVVACLLLVATAEAVRRYHARSLAGERRFHAAEDLAVDAFGILEELHPEDRALADPAFDAMLHGRSPSFELVYRMQRPDGTLRWVRDKAWLGRADEIERVVGVMTDMLASLDEIIRRTLAHHGSDDETVDVSGPAIHVGAGSVPLVHMAFHELATNSAKYGALSVPDGRVGVRWEIESDASSGEALLRLTWRESGGPVVRPPPRRGFGSLLVEHALAAELGGEIAVAFPPAGVTCTMRLPLSGPLTIGDKAA